MYAPMFICVFLQTFCASRQGEHAKSECSKHATTEQQAPRPHTTVVEQSKKHAMNVCGAARMVVLIVGRAVGFLRPRLQDHP